MSKGQRIAAAVAFLLDHGAEGYSKITSSKLIVAGACWKRVPRAVRGLEIVRRLSADSACLRGQRSASDEHHDVLLGFRRRRVHRQAAAGAARRGRIGTEPGRHREKYLVLPVCPPCLFRNVHRNRAIRRPRRAHCSVRIFGRGENLWKPSPPLAPHIGQSFTEIGIDRCCPRIAARSCGGVVAQTFEGFTSDTLLQQRHQVLIGDGQQDVVYHRGPLLSRTGPAISPLSLESEKSALSSVESCASRTDRAGGPATSR